MGTLATTVAVSKLIRCCRGGVGNQMGLLLPSTIRYRGFRVDMSMHGGGGGGFGCVDKAAMFSERFGAFPSFCTAANVNVNMEEAAMTTGNVSLEAKPGLDDGGEKKEDSADAIRDAANLLDIRVGHIIKAWRHEEADSLYVEEVDVGEAEPRIICSGLVNYIPLDYLQDRKVIVLANLKPRNMRGVKSNGMLMAASDASHENVELLEPPEDSIAGERIWFGSQEDKENQPLPATPNQVQKKKIWESVQPHLKTDDSCVAMLGEHVMQTSAGVVTCRSLKNANIS